MADCSGVNVNPISGELILRWRHWLQAKGSLPLSLALTYRATSSRSGIWGQGFFSPLIAHLEIGEETIAMVKDSGHVTGYLILGSGPDQEFVPQWDKYNALELESWDTIRNFDRRAARRRHRDAARRHREARRDGGDYRRVSGPRSAP